MIPKLYRVTGSWPGKLFLSSRPRGGDWLGDEVLGWRRSGIDTVVSLLTSEEEQELDLVEEASEARKHDLAFVSFPIPDRGVPSNASTLTNFLENIHRDLQHGKNVLVHCRQGIRKNGLRCCVLTCSGGDGARISHPRSFKRAGSSHSGDTRTGKLYLQNCGERQLKPLKTLHSARIQIKLDMFHKMSTNDHQSTTGHCCPN